MLLLRGLTVGQSLKLQYSLIISKWVSLIYLLLLFPQSHFFQNTAVRLFHCQEIKMFQSRTVDKSTYMYNGDAEVRFYPGPHKLYQEEQIASIDKRFKSGLVLYTPRYKRLMYQMSRDAPLKGAPKSKIICFIDKGSLPNCQTINWMMVSSHYVNQGLMGYPPSNNNTFEVFWNSILFCFDLICLVSN